MALKKGTLRQRIAIFILSVICLIAFFETISAVFFVYSGKRKVEMFCSCKETSLGRSSEGLDALAMKMGLDVDSVKLENGRTVLLAHAGWLFVRWSCRIELEKGIILKKDIHFSD